MPATSWLLDHCPPDYRGYAGWRKHPVALAWVATRHIDAQLEAMRGAIADPVPVSAMVHGEYGLEGVFLGVRARLGRTGVVEIIEDRLDEAELAALGKAAASIKQRLGIATES